MLDRQPFLITLGRTNVLILLVAIVAALALFGVFIVHVAGMQDMRAENKAFAFVERLLSERLRSLERTVVDYADSGASYANLHLEVDHSWAYVQDNLGRSLYEHLGIDYAALIDAEDRERYSVVQGKLKFGRQVLRLGNGIDELVRSARDLGEREAVSGFLVGPDLEPMLVSASPLSPGGDDTVAQDDRAPTVLVFADRLTPEEIGSFRQELFVGELELRRNDRPARIGDPHTFPTVDGRQHFRIHLRAPTPGQDMLKALAPGTVTIVALLLGALTLVTVQGRRIAAVNRRNEQALDSARRHAEHLALHDPVTGLPNRLQLDKRAEGVLQNGLAQAGILYLDLDRFKTINDHFGHAAGDLVLRTIASRLHVALAEGETAARVGGDEFVLLVQRSDDEIERPCRTLIALVSRPVLHEGRPLSVGVSIGIARLDCREGFEDALRRADAALYEAKRDGRGCSRWAKWDEGFEAVSVGTRS